MLSLFVISHQKNLFIFLPEMAKQMGIYRPRSPQKSPFYQCIADHFEGLVQAYDERYEREYGFWRPVISEVIQKYLEYGDLTHRFARIRCDHCGQTLLLAFSYKGRYFCPSCQVISIQTWGNMGANFHPHLHTLVTKGGFNAYSVFHTLTWIDTQKMALLFKEKVFTMLIQEEKICEGLTGRIRQCSHSGFNIQNEVEISADAEKGRQTLAQYIIKTPVSQEKWSMIGKFESVPCKNSI